MCRHQFHLLSIFHYHFKMWSKKNHTVARHFIPFHSLLARSLCGWGMSESLKIEEQKKFGTSPSTTTVHLEFSYKLSGNCTWKFIFALQWEHTQQFLCSLVLSTDEARQFISQRILIIFNKRHLCEIFRFHFQSWRRICANIRPKRERVFFMLMRICVDCGIVVIKIMEFGRRKEKRVNGNKRAHQLTFDTLFWQVRNLIMFPFVSWQEISLSF